MIELTGFQEFYRILEKMKEQAVPILTEAVNKASELAKSEMEKRAEGRAKESLTLKKAQIKGSRISGRVYIKSGYKWVVPYELGHMLVAFGHDTNKYIKGSAFMRRGVDENKEAILDKIAEGANKVLDLYGE